MLSVTSRRRFWALPMESTLLQSITMLKESTPADYVWGHSYPHVVDVMHDIVRQYVQADQATRASAQESLDLRVRWVILQYAWECSERAVRTGDPELVREGLLSIAIEDGRYDLRDSIVRMAVLHASACALTLDPLSLFQEAADVALSELTQEELRSFPKRLPEHRDLEKAFSSIKRVGRGNDFRYVMELPSLSPSLFARFRRWLGF